MRILLAHNYTKGFATGGEGHVFEDEAQLLEHNGHEVFKLYCSNSEATDAPLFGKIKYFLNAPWSPVGYARLKKAIAEHKPDVIHIHNFFLVFSPSVFKAAYDAKIPVVVTLHNYRMASPCSQLLRKGLICEECIGRNPWRILLYKCYKNSFWASLLRYRIYFLSRKRYNWERYVNKFIALTEFGKNKLIQNDLNEQQLCVLANCAPNPLKKEEPPNHGHGALFVGTLSQDKGISLLIESWKDINYPLTVVGTGPLESELKKKASQNVTFTGLQTREQVLTHFKNCSFLILPSILYEGFPLVLVEAMAMGRAVLVSGHGAMAAVVRDGVTGLHFKPQDSTDLIKKAMILINSPELAKNIGRAGRNEYIKHYTPEKHYENLIDIYKSVITNQDAK